MQSLAAFQFSIPNQHSRQTTPARIADANHGPGMRAHVRVKHSSNDAQGTSLCCILPTHETASTEAVHFLTT